MQEIRYADAGMDIKKLGLCFMRKAWLVLVAAVAGAVIGGVVYAIACIVPESEREYQAVSKIYLDFAADETGEIYQAYNGYTWNDLMVTDPILDLTMEYLPEGYTREEVAAATKAEILSDLRLLTITITAHDTERCNAIMEATQKALVARGEIAKEFKNIQVIQSTGAELVTADNRMFRAVLVGLAIVTVLTLFVMLFYYILDDRILLAGDLKIVTEASFMGYAGIDGQLGRDYDDNLAYLCKKLGEVSVFIVAHGTCRADNAGQGQNASATQKELKEGGAGQGQAMSAAQKELKEGGTGQGQNASAAQENWEQLHAADGVVVMVEYGKVHAAYLAYVMEQLKLRECRVAGIAISGADEKFLRRYYGRAIGREQA